MDFDPRQLFYNRSIIVMDKAMQKENRAPWRCHYSPEIQLHVLYQVFFSSLSLSWCERSIWKPHSSNTGLNHSYCVGRSQNMIWPDLGSLKQNIPFIPTGRKSRSKRTLTFQSHTLRSWVSGEASFQIAVVCQGYTSHKMKLFYLITGNLCQSY